HDQMFAVTAEVVPPRSADPQAVRVQARGLVGYADAVNVTDNPTSSAHMSSQAGSALVAAAGLEPVMQLTCRDRNRIGLTSDLAGVAVPRGPRSAQYMRDHLPGVVVPERIMQHLEDAGPDGEAEGVRLAVEVVARLKAIQGIAGIHVMGLGKMDPVRKVIQSA